MKCPDCEHDDNRVFTTKDNFMLAVKRRYRLCLQCGCKFVTEERCTGEQWGKEHDLTPDLFEENYITRREDAKRRVAEAQARRQAQLIAKHLDRR